MGIDGMSEIILCCGKICSGKSTFADYLESNCDYFSFSADKWMLHLYGQIENRDEFEIKLEKCKSLILELSTSLLKKGKNVVLDYGFWTKVERQKYKCYFDSIKIKSTIVYFPISSNEQIAHMIKRNEHKSLSQYTFSIKDINELDSKFEEPDESIDIEYLDDYCKRKKLNYIYDYIK
jgi:Predicted kinase